MSIFIDVYPHNPITKHGFLAVHFITVLIGFHGNLENVYKLSCDQAASSYLQNTHQVLGAVKEIVSGPRETRKASVSAELGMEAILPFPGFRLRQCSRALSPIYGAGLSKYWL